MRRFLDRLYDGAGVLAALCLAAIFVVMMAASLSRVIGWPIQGADDVTAWLCGACAFLAIGHTFRHGELVRVGLWLDHLKGNARWVAELFALFVTAAFTLYMNWAVARFVYESWKFHEVAQGIIRIPIWIPQLCFVAGVLIFLVAVLDELLLVLKKQKPTYQVAEDARRASGDFSESV
ncbi:MAG TPA: TRAP transporter small permease [Burkholderiales bacterium]|jgi:TRAP-type C4-dicarboxylate transport system permease small subunit|nr:TRAP transporter small permease [Burkholderiales bacterium]